MRRSIARGKQASDLDARVKDWTYVIPAFKFANGNKTLEDMPKPAAGK